MCSVSEGCAKGLHISSPAWQEIWQAGGPGQCRSCRARRAPRSGDRSHRLCGGPRRLMPKGYSGTRKLGDRRRRWDWVPAHPERRRRQRASHACRTALSPCALALGRQLDKSPASGAHVHLRHLYIRAPTGAYGLWQHAAGFGWDHHNITTTSGSLLPASSPALPTCPRIRPTACRRFPRRPQSLKDSIVVCNMGAEVLPVLTTFGSLPATLVFFSTYKTMVRTPSMAAAAAAGQLAAAVAMLFCALPTARASSSVTHLPRISPGQPACERLLTPLLPRIVPPRSPPCRPSRSSM